MLERQGREKAIGTEDFDMTGNGLVWRGRDEASKDVLLTIQGLTDPRDRSDAVTLVFVKTGMGDNRITKINGEKSAVMEHIGFLMTNDQNAMLEKYKEKGEEAMAVVSSRSLPAPV